MAQSMMTMIKKYTLLIAIILSSFISAQALSYKLVENIPYSSNNSAYAQERCLLDVYYPEDAKDCPVLVWFHGGGLSGGNKFIPQELKDAGMVVIAVNYRLVPKVEVADCIDDAAAAVAWAFNEAQNYNGDTTKIFVSGHSAGGYLTNMIGYDKKWLAKYDIDANSIAGLIPFSGHAITHFAYRKAQGIAGTQPTIDEFAPLYYVRADAPPTVIITGDRELEMLGRYEECAYFYRMLKVVGHKETYLYELDGYDHGAMAAPAFHILKHHVNRIVKAMS